MNASALSRGELQGCYRLLDLSKSPDPLLKAEVQQLAKQRGIWLPATKEQSASLLFRGVAPTPALVERW